MREGIVLFDSGLSPYSGDVYHEVCGVIVESITIIVIVSRIFCIQTPLVLWLFKILFSLGEWAVQVFFIVS